MRASVLSIIVLATAALSSDSTAQTSFAPLPAPVFGSPRGGTLDLAFDYPHIEPQDRRFLEYVRSEGLGDRRRLFIGDAEFDRYRDSPPAFAGRKTKYVQYGLPIDLPGPFRLDYYESSDREDYTGGAKYK
ncbi:MAG: hypothetical protein V4644_00035 [Patescibacteria group bacterium]